MGLRDGETPYPASQRKLWLRRLLFGRGKRVLVFDPGEVPLGREHLKSEIMFFAIVLGLRLRGAQVIRPPRAVGGYDLVTAFFYRASARLSNVVLWRDRPSLDRMGVGELAPDTAFAEPAVAGLPHTERRTLLVTMRGKRPLPSDAWFEGIAAFARDQNLRIVTMAQVDEDEKRCAEIAARLADAEHLPWGKRSDLEQEVAVRLLYEECAFAVSDRLHVLILAAKAGVTPVEIAPSPAAKIRTHFATVGYVDVSFDSATASANDVRAFLTAQTGRNDDLRAKLLAAQTRLDRRIERALTSR
ncbi:hypothetical protein [Microbacterium thalli]|uniref:hypothetical protein n=1 Tax=Microbacterium thalli TaxID=3027921 RepID=UPI002366D1AC|nr:hypothetical protein [Microbacterium thalli]MDD7930680.1 hypothetical protein [Microbacterium thalli]